MANMSFRDQADLDAYMNQFGSVGSGGYSPQNGSYSHYADMNLLGTNEEPLGTVYAPTSSGLMLKTPDNNQYNLWGSGGATTPINQQQQQPQPNYTDMFNQWGNMFNTTLQNLRNLWGQQNQTPTSSSSTGGDPGLSNLYARANWGNYQNTGRGARYFDQNTGNYQTL